MGLPKFYFGIPQKELDGYTCNLSYRGASALHACNGAMRKWGRARRPTLNVEALITEFGEYCIPCFIDDIFSSIDEGIDFKSSVDEELTSEEIPSHYSEADVLEIIQDNCCCDCMGNQHMDWDDVTRQTVINALKAIIVLANRYPKFFELHVLPGNRLEFEE